MFQWLLHRLSCHYILKCKFFIQLIIYFDFLYFAIVDEKEGNSTRRRGRPRKKHNIQGKRLFDEQSTSEEEESISASDHEDVHDEEKQDEEDEEVPLIHSIRSSSKLRSLRISREEKKGTSTGKAAGNVSTSRMNVLNINEAYLLNISVFSEMFKQYTA